MASIQDGVPWTSGVDDNTTELTARNNAAEEAAGGVNPDLATTEVQDVASQAEMLALAAQIGDYARRTDLNNQLFVLRGDDATVLANWIAVVSTVQSVDGLTGAVSLSSRYSSAASTRTIRRRSGIDVAAQPGSFSTLSSGITDAMVRRSHLAGATTRQIHVAYANWRRVSGSESNGANNITVRGAVEYPSGTYTPLYFNGSRDVVIHPGGTAISDPCSIVIPLGTQFWTRTEVIVGSGESFMYHNLRTEDGEASQTGAGDLTTSGTITGSSPSYGPCAIFEDFLSATELRIGGIGDSIMMGTGDTTKVNWGWFARAFGAVVPAQRVAFGSETALNFSGQQSTYRRLPLLEGANIIICSYGINDISSSLANIQTRLTNVWTRAAATGVPVVQCTLTPSTTSTDSWATTTNQTVTSNETKRTQLNDWIRSLPSPISGYIEIADIAETARNSGLWKVTGAANYATSDGLHPSTAMHTLIGAGIDLNALRALI